MRASDKHHQANLTSKGVFGVNFHEFIDTEEDSTMFEIASEFGISLGDVRKLKKRLNRS
ncbi:RNA polymerase subunit sigma-70 [Pallidibacillus pasinlerensis]|uniref:RNA polymerase subunit sigma-70 n=1 Tax=Pallidibacillus pasinlerensis TaxID=2703818 RepID=A0ABX0A4B4_9BACI|nr:RNA polymerase subunit sigma-70 [Pallidibacillus pasinlerensis]NCU18275.1 RNA polymerase subunit sigma-70 [Pallidibacillus pasinlerensis]